MSSRAPDWRRHGERRSGPRGIGRGSGIKSRQMASRPNNGTEPNPDNRDTIFICHASPDDNDFVRWIGTRLTGHGYKIWADLFELKGGSPFWSTIEEALRHHACKMIFVVSAKSVDPDRIGVLNELSV